MAERYPCIDCRKHVRMNQHAIQCENCEAWQHRSRDTGISVSDYHLAVSGDMEIAFVCKPCGARISPVDENDDIADVYSHYITPALISDSDSFRIEVPFEEPVIIHERSLDDYPLPDEVTPDAPLTYEVIPNGSQKGFDLLVDSVGYSYNIKDRRGKCVRWSCSVKNKTMRCMATVSQKDGNYKQGTVEHTHSPDPSKEVNAKVAKQAKEIASKDVFTSARSIVSQARKFVIESGVGTVKEEYLARRANRKRVAMRPADPN